MIYAGDEDMSWGEDENPANESYEDDCFLDEEDEQEMLLRDYPETQENFDIASGDYVWVVMAWGSPQVFKTPDHARAYVHKYFESAEFKPMIEKVEFRDGKL